MIDYRLFTNEDEEIPGEGVLLKKARARSKGGMVTDTVTPGQSSVLPNTRSRLAQIYGDLDKLESQEVDTSALQAFARQQSERGQSSMLNALAAQFAGESFEPVQTQFLKRAAAASDPMKIGGGILTPDGQFVKDPFAARDTRTSALERQATALEKLHSDQRREDERRQDRLDAQADLKTYRNATLAARGNDGASDARIWRAEDTLRGDFDKLTKDLREEMNATSKITQIVSATPPGGKPDAITQQSLVILLNKFLDPGSVVREGEFDRVVKAQGLEGQARNLADRILRGQPLDLNTINQINGLAKLYSEAAEKKIRNHATDYIDIAKRRKLNPENIISDPRFRGVSQPSNPPAGGDALSPQEQAELDALRKRFNKGAP